jgi:chromate reductase, NAD(P)H dehydrogenase (quinone)
MNVVGICGSLRANSYNMLALRAAQKLAPAGMDISIYSLKDVPLYNDDVRAQGVPESVQALKEACARADAILIASPEYNYSISGVLKNALDWLSRPPLLPFDGKPVAIMGASTGILGTARGQYHLRQVLVYMNTFTLNKPEVFISTADKKFDASGELIDPIAIKLIGDQLTNLQKLAERLNPQLATA